jgi:hypothetical protein
VPRYHRPHLLEYSVGGRVLTPDSSILPQDHRGLNAHLVTRRRAIGRQPLRGTADEDKAHRAGPFVADRREVSKLRAEVQVLPTSEAPIAGADACRRLKIVDGERDGIGWIGHPPAS